MLVVDPSTQRVHEGYDRVILGLYRDDGKEHGNFYNGVL